MNRLFSAPDAIDLTTWVHECLMSGARHLLIDLHCVSFMDSRGLGALLIAHNRVEKIGGKLGICSLNGQARMLLELTQMEKVFHVYDNPAEFEQVFWEKVVSNSGEAKRL